MLKMRIEDEVKSVGEILDSVEGCKYYQKGVQDTLAALTDVAKSNPVISVEDAISIVFEEYLHKRNEVAMQYAVEQNRKSKSL